jgi:hypothetical protein
MMFCWYSNLTVGSLGEFMHSVRFSIFLAQYATVSVRHLLIGTFILLSGCSLVNTAPSKDDVLVAIRNVTTQLNLPSGFHPANATVGSCVWQESPEGHVCDITLVSAEIPLIGAVSVPMRLRFAKRDGRWAAFLL